MMAGMDAPPPNLQGNYSGSCVMCLRGTDTALAFTGEAEWLIAGLINLGLARDDANRTAFAMFEDMGCDPDMVPEGRQTFGVRVCAECVSKAPYSGFPSPGVEAFGVPNIAQR